MPCYTERTISLDLNVADEGVLLRALAALGFRHIERTADRLTALTPEGWLVTIREGRADVSGSQLNRADATAVVARIHQGYAREAVRTAAKRFGFALTLDRTNADHLTLAKRSF